MAETKHKNRYIILAALFINAFCVGGIYAWSVFSGSLAEFRNWDYAQVTLAYSLMSLLISVFGIAGGKILDRFGPKRMMLAASVLWGCGWFLTGCVTEIWQLYIVFSVIAAFGSGLAYNPSLTTAVRWFQDKRGMASGLITGGCGLASLIIAPVANMLLEEYNVSMAFRIIGIAFFVLMFCASLLVETPNTESASKGLNNKRENKGNEKFDKDWRGMLRDKRFYLLWFAFLGGCVSGLMMIGHASTIGQEIAEITSAQAALLVGIMAVANFCGRIMMGTVSDHMGRYQTVMVCMLISAVDMVIMSRASGFVIFVAALIILCVCFGGVLSIFPNLVSDNFGLANMGMNYGIVFTAYGIAAVVGPMTASAVKNMYGSYNFAFVIAGMFATIALILITITYKMSKVNKPK